MLRNFYNRIQSKLVKRYRVELIDDITLSQSKQFILKPVTVILIGALLFLGIVGGTAALVIYTPALHKLIPGYVNPETYNQRIEEMASQVDAIQAEYERWMAYAASLQKSVGIDDGSGFAFSEEKLDSMRRVREAALSAQGESYTPSAPPALETAPVSSSEQNNAYSTPSAVDGYGQVDAPSRPVAIKVSSRPVLMNLFSPLEGKLINPFSQATQHYGVDIVAEENTLISSVADGFVIMSEYSDDNGWVIGVASDDNVVAFYKHNSRLLKKAGTYVSAGEPVAVIGNSGENSTGMHLHLELWHEGKPINPADYIEFN